MIFLRRGVGRLSHESEPRDHHGAAGRPHPAPRKPSSGCTGFPDWMRELHEEHDAHKTEIDALSNRRGGRPGTPRPAEAAIAGRPGKAQEVPAADQQGQHAARVRRAPPGDRHRQGADHELRGAGASRPSSATTRPRRSWPPCARASASSRSAMPPSWPAGRARSPRSPSQVEALQAPARRAARRACRAACRRSSSASWTATPGGARRRSGRSSGPAARQREWHCSACNYRVRPQVVVEIRNSDNLVQCDSCKRILFLVEEAQA